MNDGLDVLSHANAGDRAFFGRHEHSEFVRARAVENVISTLPEISLSQPTTPAPKVLAEAAGASARRSLTEESDEESPALIAKAWLVKCSGNARSRHAITLR